MDQITRLLASGNIIRANGFDIFAEQDSERVADLDWRPDKGSVLYHWLRGGNCLWAIQSGSTVRASIMGMERVRVPKDLLEGVKEDGESRVWVQGGYTFSVTRDEDGRLYTALLGLPSGGSASQAWNQEVTKVGTGDTFLEAVDDVFNMDPPPAD
jgi:hypothetical protein